MTVSSAPSTSVTAWHTEKGHRPMKHQVLANRGPLGDPRAAAASVALSHHRAHSPRWRICPGRPLSSPQDLWARPGCPHLSLVVKPTGDVSGIWSPALALRRPQAG